MKERQRSGRRLALVVALLVVLVLVIGAPASLRALQGQEPPAAPPPESLDLQVTSLAGLPDKDNGNPKIESALQAELAGGGEAQTQAADTVEVEISIAAGSAAVVSEAITAAGGTVRITSLDGKLLQVILPTGVVKQIAALPEVLMVRSVSRAEGLEGELTAGLATIENLRTTNANIWQNAGFSGDGVRIGVLDTGFSGATALIGADLPPLGRIALSDFTGAQFSNDDVAHGTACAEIIHDMAPGATLLLARVSSLLEIQQAVLWFIENDVTIISSSIGFTAFVPGDGSGPLADTVDYARDRGVLWITAAGNERERHWSGTAFDLDGDGFLNYYGLYEVNYFNEPIPAGYVIDARARWSDWTFVTQDIDLYLVRWNLFLERWELIAGSTDYQYGAAGQLPREALRAVTTGLPTYYGVVLYSPFGARPSNIDVFTLKSPAPLLIQSPARSLADLGDSPAAMTVAAVDSSFPYYREPYSAEGPTNGPGGFRTPGFAKPEIAGFANVSTVSYGTRRFNGTSSATPHVAGAAALVAEAYASDATPNFIQSFLQGRAIDRGLFGRDTQFGYGQLFLGRPPVEAVDYDFDRDQKSDVLWRNDTTGETIFERSADPDLGNAVEADNAGDHAVSVADFTGDGRADILWFNPDTRLVSLTDHASSSDVATPFGLLNSGWKIVGAGDFNDDGVDDVLVRNLVFGFNQIWFMSSGQISRAYFTGWASPTWKLAGVGDVNGDGNDDILWRTASGRIVRWLMDQHIVTASNNLAFYPGGTGWSLDALADFNGDGVDDLIWRNQGSGIQRGWTRIFFMRNGQPAAQSWGPPVASLDWQIAAAGDYNGDKDADLYWRNLITGERFLSLMRDGVQITGVTFAAYNFNWSVVGQGTYDGLLLGTEASAAVSPAQAGGPGSPGGTPPPSPVTPGATPPDTPDVPDPGTPEEVSVEPNNDLTLGEGVDVDVSSARTLAQALTTGQEKVYLPVVVK